MNKGCSHTFSEIFLHLNWHCKGDRPLITPELEGPLYEYLASYCSRTKGVHFKGVGGTEDHAHLAMQVETMVKLDEFIGQIKGASSHEMNQRSGRHVLEWQRGYGVVSFAKANLPGILRYVERQKEHHRVGTTREGLERHGEEEDEQGEE